MSVPGTVFVPFSKFKDIEVSVLQVFDSFRNEKTT